MAVHVRSLSHRWLGLVWNSPTRSSQRGVSSWTRPFPTSRGGVLTSSRPLHTDPLGDLYGNQSVQRHVGRLLEEHAALANQLQGACLGDAERRGLSRRRAELRPLVELQEEIRLALSDLEEVSSLRRGEGCVCVCVCDVMLL